MIDREKMLKSCPFCGGNAMTTKLELNPESILNGMWIIGCDGINGSICPGYIYKCSPFYISRELAVKMWNNRDGKRQIDKAPTVSAQEKIVSFGRWKKLPGGMSPGGTPSYVCDRCGGTEHLYGVEYPEKKLQCKVCGQINVYPWEKVDWT